MIVALRRRPNCRRDLAETAKTAAVVATMRIRSNTRGLCAHSTISRTNRSNRTSVCLSKLSDAQISQQYSVRIRTDETVRGLLPPIELRSLNPDHSELAREMAARAPLAWIPQTRAVHRGFPRKGRRVGRTSSFSRLARRSLALRPAHLRGHQFVTRYTEGFSHFVTSMTAPVASGWSGCRAGLAPTGKRRLSRRTPIAGSRTFAARKTLNLLGSPCAEKFSRFAAARLAAGLNSPLTKSAVV